MGPRIPRTPKDYVMADPTNDIEPTTFTVTDTDAGQRLDKLVVAAFQSRLGRARAKALFESAAVRVDGHVARKGDVAVAGTVISVVLDEPLDATAVADPDAPLDVRLELAEVVIVCKPAGQPTAPIRGGERGTLVNALVARYPEMAAFGHSSKEPGIVHRLDTDTSGFVVAARTSAAFEALVRGLRRGEIRKSYLLVCDGTDLADTGTIDIPLCPHPKDAKRVLACSHPRDQARYSPRPATTSYRVIERSTRLALVEASAPKASRHQIRAHFAAIGHPLVGDALYGELDAAIGRQALHAYQVSWKGSPSVPAFDVRDGVPDEFRALLDADAGG